MIDWNYDKETKTLTISGSGEMKDYNVDNKAPWTKLNIEKVIIEDGVTGIGGCAFYDCRNLTSVEIPDSVTEIEWGAFHGCSSLTSVTIPDRVTYIKFEAFEYCSSLTSITIPDSVTGIGISAFSGCKNLTSVTILNGVTSIRNYAFYGCSSLTSVSIPDSVTSIGDRAFESCPNLKSLTLPNIAGCNHITFHYHKDEPYSKQIEMIVNKNYSVNMKSEVKYDLLWQLFRVKPDEGELIAYIKKNFSRMMHFAIDHNDTEAVNKICENGELLTSKNIDNLIDYAINNTQKGGSLEIQAVLMNYKNKHFGDKKKTLRL